MEQDEMKGWFSPWPRGKPDFEKKKMKATKITAGGIILLCLRSFRMTAFFAMFLVFLKELIPALKTGLLASAILACFFVVYAILDYIIILPQEQNFAYNKNPGILRLEGKVDTNKQILQSLKRKVDELLKNSGG